MFIENNSDTEHWPSKWKNVSLILNEVRFIVFNTGAIKVASLTYILTKDRIALTEIISVHQL